MLERRIRADGRSRLKRTVPPRLLEPEGQNGPRRVHPIKRHPQLANGMLQAHATIVMALENPLYLALKVENACHETYVQIVIWLPSTPATLGERSRSLENYDDSVMSPRKFLTTSLGAA